MILGPTGRNFAAGMSGGFAFVWDPDRSLFRRMNREMVDIDPLDDEDVDWLRGIVTLHLEATGSEVAERILSKWWSNVGSFSEDVPEGLQARARSPTRRDRARRRRRRSGHGGARLTWVRRHGFMKYERELPKRRPIPVRVLDWQEVYEDFPPEKVRTAGRALHGLRHPVLPHRLPAREPHPRVERPRVPRPLAGRERPAARDATTSPSSPAGLCPAPCEAACVLGINEPPVTIKQIEVEIIDRAWEEGWVVPVIPQTQDGQARRRRRLRARRASRPRSS